MKLPSTANRSNSNGEQLTNFGIVKLLPHKNVGYDRDQKYFTNSLESHGRTRTSNFININFRSGISKLFHKLFHEQNCHNNN